MEVETKQSSKLYMGLHPIISYQTDGGFECSFTKLVGPNKKRRTMKDDSNKENSLHPFSAMSRYQSPFPSSGVTIDVLQSSSPNSISTCREPFTDISNNLNQGTAQSCITSTVPTNKKQRKIKPSRIKESAADLFGKDAFSAEVSTHEQENAAEMFELLDDVELCFKSGYCSLGAPSEKCLKYGAIIWKEERVNKNVKKGVYEFSICYGKGQIKLPATPSTPEYMMQLNNDAKKRNKFRCLIRIYNAMFAFSSMGGKVDHSVNNGSSPYVYRLNEQNHHVFGSLIPDDGDDPKFCQLYIYDTEHENRIAYLENLAASTLRKPCMTDQEIVNAFQVPICDDLVMVHELEDIGMDARG
ncbi:hypothetical protein AgCh_017287 [Apium graveolens]